jgi:hypothetical protein
VVAGRCSSIRSQHLGATPAPLRDQQCVAPYSPLFYFTTVVWLRHIAESRYFLSQGGFMKIAVLEVRYACGLILTDRVVVRASSRLILPPRLTALLAELERSERRTSTSVTVDGVTYRVEGTPEAELVLGSRLGFAERLVRGLQSVASPNAARRRLNRRFVHMLSAFSVIGACYLVQSTKNWDTRAIVETVLLCAASVALFVTGHLCFAGDHEST